MNRAEEIIKKITDRGLTVSGVERRADIASGTLGRWKRENPKTFEIEDNINKAIEDLSNEIHPGAER